MNARIVMRTRKVRQRGSSALELALVSLVAFVPLLFGIVQMGLVFFTLNFAAEATRRAARTAVVCDVADESKIVDRIRSQLPMLLRDGSDIEIAYDQPAACVNPGQPCVVTVTLVPGAQVPNIIPFWDFTWSLPTLRTTLTQESLASSIDGSANPVCD